MPQQGDSIETLYVTLAARADQLMQDAEAATQAVIRKLDQIEEKTKETEGAFGSLGSFIKQSLSVAAGMGIAQIGGSLTAAITGFGKALISSNAQMQTFERSFETLTGSAEEAGEIIEWVKEQAKATPFDVPGLISASQMLMTWGLDLKEWFTVVGDTAAAMNRPLSQVVNAVGTLASGQTGEAVRRFRDLGINLREFEQLEFDAQGSLVTPLQEAIPIVKQIMEDKFGGMMESQSKTWAGVISNLGDTWQQFVQVVGEPIFEELNAALFSLYQWVEDNQEQIEGFARNLGAVLGGVLDVIGAVLDRFGDLIRMIDEVAQRVAGPEWMQRGVKAGQQVAGLLGGALRVAPDLAGGLLAGESLEEAARSAGAAWAETALAIGNADAVSDKLADTTVTLTEAQLAGVQAVRALGGAYAELSDAEIQAAVEAEKEQLATAELASAITSALIPSLGEAIEAHVEEAAATNEVVNAYDEAVTAYDEAIARQEELRAALEATRAEQEANLELAQEVADKLGDRLADAMEKYQATLSDAAESTAEAIADIESKAAQAEAAAIAKSQADITKAREDFAREQMQRRRQFNVEWARLIREQNQEVLDAEWEYQFAKENLLIEGDEIALAELEARYKHESATRAREQADARGDMQTNFEMENQARQEQFELQIRELENRLQQELENIRQRAREEVQAKEEALAEKKQKEDEALQERLMKIGEMQAQEVQDNQTVTNMLIEMWRQLYGDQAAAAIQAGVVQRQELEAIRQQALATASALANVRLGSAVGTGGRQGPVRRPGGGYARQAGGYSPPGESTVVTHTGEFMSDAATTRALEQAVGGPLTQQSVRSLAESRRVVDFNLYGHGLPADMIAEMRQSLAELIDAFREEGDTF